MSKRMPKHTRPVMSAQLREAVLHVTSAQIPLGIDGRAPDDTGVWEILLYAAVNQLTIESACQELEQAPSGNTVREHLARALDNRRAAVVKLEEQINAARRDQLPGRVRRRLSQRRFEIAIDRHDIPYHGQPALSPDEVRRGPAKSGTTHFHSYATLAIVHDQRRYELAMTFVWADESLAQVVERLIQAAKRLQLRLRRAYLDKGFCGREVFAVLRAQRLPYIMPIPLRGKKDEHGVYQGGIGQLFTPVAGVSTPATRSMPTRRTPTPPTWRLCARIAAGGMVVIGRPGLPMPCMGSIISRPIRFSPSIAGVLDWSNASASPHWSKARARKPSGRFRDVLIIGCGRARMDAEKD